jgi:CubicO group peptidase (beta-lactamase class C family)
VGQDHDIHLLTHTSGIPNFTSFPDYRQYERDDVKPVDLVAKFKDKPLDFEPGAEFRYSNSGYIVLGYILEKVAGEQYAKFVQENLFKPLGMKDTGVDRNVMVLPHRAQGYEAHTGDPKNAEYVNMTVPFSAGSLYSTTGDLLKWEQGLFGGKVLTPASLKKMTTPFKANYAFGLTTPPFPGHRLYTHGGAIQGFTTSLAYFPEEKDGPVTIIVLANLGTAADEIAQGLSRTFFGLPAPLAPETPVVHTEVTVPAKLLAEYEGTYQLTPRFAIVITVEDGHLVAQGTGQPKGAIFAESETKFFAKVVDAEFEFNRDTAGKVISMTLHQNGNEITGMRN